jgi:hypothetical protein
MIIDSLNSTFNELFNLFLCLLALSFYIYALNGGGNNANSWPVFDLLL